MRNKLPKGPGRPKGSANKLTKDIRQAIAEAFDKAGGVDYLVKIAKTQPQTFCSLVGKIVPQEVKAAVTHAYDAGSLTDSDLAAIALGRRSGITAAEADTEIAH